MAPKNSIQETHCPVCKFPIRDEHEKHLSDSKEVKCANCGDFILTRTLEASLEAECSTKKNLRPLLSYNIRKMQHEGKLPTISTFVLENILQNSTLPKLEEQANNLILAFGESLNGPGHLNIVKPETHQATAGALDKTGFWFLIKSLKEGGDIQATFESNETIPDTARLTLTLQGWQRYEELRRGTTTSRKAFMAMQFGEEPLNSFYKNTLIDAVDQTGFDLGTVNEKPEAGLIDIKMQNDIRTSRFLIADLSHENQNVFWEAGFAEGLGKPVIYICEKSIWDSKIKNRFDTNHRHTVIWDEKNFGEAAEHLKATIRATLPAEAKLTDD